MKRMEEGIFVFFSFLLFTYMGFIKGARERSGKAKVTITMCGQVRRGSRTRT